MAALAKLQTAKISTTKTNTQRNAPNSSVAHQRQANKVTHNLHIKYN